MRRRKKKKERAKVAKAKEKRIKERAKESPQKVRATRESLLGGPKAIARGSLPGEVKALKRERIPKEKAREKRKVKERAYPVLQVREGHQRRSSSCRRRVPRATGHACGYMEKKVWPDAPMVANAGTRMT
jgi:hypothetical protein